MVQVDVFWGYSWGASLAAAAGPRLKQAEKPLETKYFVWALVFLAIFWAPTGMLLLLRHPSWETMQAASSFASMSEWLILSFGVTNVTQGILGFWVGARLLRRDHDYLAELNWLAGYFAMFFILLYGWDGLGYDRFLYDRDLWPGSPAWRPGIATEGGALAAMGRFLTSGVAFTLYTDGVYLLPPFFVLVLRWTQSKAPVRSVLSYLALVFGFGLGSAAVAALTVRAVAALLGIADQVARAQGAAPAAMGAHVASYLVGLPVSCALLWLFVFRPGRWGARLLLRWRQT